MLHCFADHQIHLPGKCLLAQFVQAVEVITFYHIPDRLGIRKFNYSYCLDSALAHDLLSGFKALHIAATKFGEYPDDLGKIGLETGYIPGIGNGVYDQICFIVHRDLFHLTGSKSLRGKCMEYIYD